MIFGFKKIFSLITVSALLINLVLPALSSAKVYAQEIITLPETNQNEIISIPPIDQNIIQEADLNFPTDVPINSEATPTAIENIPAPLSIPQENIAPEPSVFPSITPTPSATLVPPNDLPQTNDSPSTPSAVSITTTFPVWKNLENNTYETTEIVELNKEYTAPQNNKVKVKFTILPSLPGKLTIKEIKLSEDQVRDLQAVSDTAYDITSTMENGLFQYDLTLPLPDSAKGKDVEVKSAETVGSISNAQTVDEPKEETADFITIKDLNHFTVFILTSPAPDTIQRILINEIAPTATTEWVELFNNGTSPVNLAAGTGWVINNSANNPQSLSALGTIAPAGRAVFEAPSNWLSNTAPETISILNELGTTIDTVTISLTAPGIAVDHYPLAAESVGRETDGVAQWVIFPTPSKGTANAIPQTGGAGSLSQTGPIAPAGGLRAGFPVWYKDSNGLALDLMEAADGFGISDPVDPANPFSGQIGFNAEGFWWSAEADMPTSGGDALLVQAIEAAFAGEAAVDGEQSAFARVRIRIDVAEPGTYVVTYPYGQKTYVVTEPGVRAINDSVDIGCFDTGAGITCDQATAPNFSTLLQGGIGPFLTWDNLSDPALVNPSNPGRKYVGNPITAHTVTGSPTGNNFFRITGPNIGGPGINSIQTNLFVVTGRLADASAPVITLHGSNPVNVNQNAVYTDAGATALDDLDGNLTGSIVVTGLPVDTSTLGSKTVTYTVTDSAGRTSVATRTVNVVEGGEVDVTAPVITLLGETTVDVTQGTPYIDAGATALDNVDGDITGSIVTTNPVNTAIIGTYVVTYNVADAAGNPATEVTRSVNVVADTIAPIITIIGSNPVNVLTGAAYTDAGAAATDNVDGDLTASIITTGLPVDTTVPGIFTVTYNVADAAGNIATATRTVNVKDTLSAGLVGVGPVAPDGGLIAGFPVWYKDSNGLALDLMEAADGFGISDPVDPSNPFSGQIGFNAEGFWWSATAIPADTVNTVNAAPVTGILVLAIEAAFAGEAAVDGEQSAFNRLRYRVDGLVPGETYTIRHPYGNAEEIAEADGTINVTDDIGCFDTGDGVTCNQATAPNFSTAFLGQVGPFLTWDTFNPNPALTDPLLTNLGNPGRRYVGNPAINHAVTGSPIGQNLFSVTGPGLTNFSTTLFSVNGRLADTTPPVITLNGVNPDSIIQNGSYVDPGATALDDFDGNVAVTVAGVPVDTSVVGPKTITYSATDRSGNTATANRTVNVVGADTTAPVITILGVSPVNVTIGDPYVDAGATALDNVDGDITASIVTTNPVNTAVIGSYTVTYNVSDTAGNPATEATRTVNVVAPADVTPPVFSAINASSNNSNPALAKSGDILTVSFETNEPLSINPAVTIGGADMTFVSLVGSTYTYNRTLDGTETASGQISINGSDLSGNQGSDSAVAFPLDFNLPTGLISINSGAIYTTTTAVTLNFTGVSADVTQMQLRNGATGAFQAAIAYEATHAYTLPDIQGLRTISVRFIDSAGNVNSSVISDDIILDTVIPTDPADVASTSHTSASSSDNTIDMAWTPAGTLPGATDITSGVKGYSYSFTNGAADVPDNVQDLDATITGVTSSALANGTWYFHLRTVDNALNWTSTVHTGPFNISVSVIPPVTTDNIEAQWNRAGVGVMLTCAPSNGLTCANTYYTTDGSDPTTSSLSGTSFALTTDGIYTIKYFSVDSDGNQEVIKTAANQVKIDTTSPTDPVPASATHSLSTWSNDNTVDVTWSGASDNLSGVSGFYTEWNTSAAIMNGPVVKEHEAAVSSETGPALSDGANHYFHIATLDNAGNWTTTSHFGPFWIDTNAPAITGLTNDANVLQSKTWTWDSTDTNAQFRFSVDQNVSGVPAGAYSNIKTATQNTGTGTYYLHVQAIDTAGNESAMVTVSTILDNRLGTITVIKDAIPNDPQDFGFRLRNVLIDESFSVDDDGDNTNDLSNIKAFADLQPGSYSLQENGVSNWITSIICQDADNSTTIDANARTATIDLDRGENVICTFTNTLKMSISGMKFNDLNGDGDKDTGEPGLPDWTIYLDTNDNGALDQGETSTITDINGNYQFTDLSGGAYNIREVLQNTWTQTAPASGKYTLTVTGNASLINKDFGNFKKALITGYKWKDLDADGIWDVNEPALGSWEITLSRVIPPLVESPLGGPLSTETVELLSTATTAAETGLFSFIIDNPGQYRIGEKSVTGWQQTSPTGSFFDVFVTLSGEEITKDKLNRDIHFGNTPVYTVGDQGTFISTGGGNGETPSIISLGTSVLTTEANGGTSNVSIPDGTVISRVDEGTFDLNLISISTPLIDSIAGLGNGVAVDGVLQWGIPNLGLQFTNPITLNIYVGTDLNGNTLDVMRSITGTSDWTTDGIVAPATCVVTNGMCAFQATKASFYTAFHDSDDSDEDEDEDEEENEDEDEEEEDDGSEDGGASNNTGGTPSSTPTVTPTPTTTTTTPTPTVTTVPAATNMPTVTLTPTPTPVTLASNASSGSDNTESSNNSSSDGNSSSGAQSCGDGKPSNAPVLSVVSTGENEVTLSWTKAGDPVSYYLLAFGLFSGSLQYGNPNIGGKDVTSYTVKELSGGTPYFFRVRAGNGCAPGDYSNEVQAVPSGKQIANVIPSEFGEGILGATTDEEQESNDSSTAKEVKGDTDTVNNQKTEESVPTNIFGLTNSRPAQILLLLFIIGFSAIGVRFIFRGKF